MSQITVRQANLSDASSITALNNRLIARWVRYGIDNEELSTGNDDLTSLSAGCKAVPGPASRCTRSISPARCAAPTVSRWWPRSRARLGPRPRSSSGREPEPFGHHINVSRLAVHSGAGRYRPGQRPADPYPANRRGDPLPPGDGRDASDDAALYEHHRFHRRTAASGWRSARRKAACSTGRPSYELPAGASIKGWHMPLGRYQNARQEWERIVPGF